MKVLNRHYGTNLILLIRYGMVSCAKKIGYVFLLDFSSKYYWKQDVDTCSFPSIVSKQAYSKAYVFEVSSEPLKAFTGFSSPCGDHLNIRNYLAGQKSSPLKASTADFLMLVLQMCMLVVIDAFYNI